MGLLKNIWNGVKTAAGKVWNGVKELGGGVATGMMLYNPVTANATASLINTNKNIETNFQIAKLNSIVSRENTLDMIEANRQNTNNRIVADWHLQQDRNEFAAQMETRREEFRIEELKTQWLNQYSLQKDNQKFNYEEARRRHDEAIQLANLSYENQQKIEKYRQEWENIRLEKRQDFELILMEARQKQEWALRKYDRETMLIQASIQLQNMMQSAEYNRILNNHPLISSSIPTLSIYKKLDPNKPVPLLVIISPPAVEFEKVPHAGQGLAKIETTLTDKLREFLQDNNNYPVKSSIRPTKFLGGVWDSKRLHSEGAMENLYYTHQSIPTLILESKVDGDLINVYVTNWDSMDTHYDYKRIISIPWKDVLYPLARENARLWRETRNQLLDEGRTPKEIAEEGGDDEENLKILEAEEREQKQGRNKRRDYKVNDDEYIQELADFLGSVHCILAGLAADQYHLYHYDVTPLLPTLLPELLEKIDDVELKNELINIIIFIYRGIYQSIKMINPSRLPDLALDFALSLSQLDDKFWARSQMNYALISWLELRDASLIAKDALSQEDNLANQVQLTQVLLTAMASLVIPADVQYITKINQCLAALENRLFSILDSCFTRGMKRVETAEYAIAITDFDQVIQLDANYLQGHYQRGLAYLNLKQPEQAIADFTTTLQFDPNYAEAFRYRGDAYNQLGNRATGVNDRKKALQYYQQAVNDYNQAIGLGINVIIEKRDDVIDKIDGIRQKEEQEKRAAEEKQEQAKRAAQERQAKAETAFKAGVEALVNKDFERAISQFERALNYGHSQAAAKLAEAQKLLKFSSLIIDLGNEVTLELVEIPGGKFNIGEGSNTHNGNIRAFLMGKYPVTQAQWEQVAKMPKINTDLNADPANFKGKNRPVEQVNWHEAVEFCERLKKHTGGRQFALPSEAQWEYAARAESTTKYHFGDSDSQLSQYAWYSGNSNSQTADVIKADGTPARKGNKWLLHDMYGNVREWCADYWHSNYNGAPTDGSAWIVGGDSSNRVTRGGSCYDFDPNCCSAYRGSNSAGGRNYAIGFRVVCACG